MKKRKSKNVQPEPKLNSEQKDDGLQVSPAIANALVVGSQSLDCYGRDLEHPFIKKYFIGNPYFILKEETVLQSLKFP